MSDFETQVTGAFGENVVIAEFLKRNFDIYLPVVDRGVDCIVRTSTGNYYEVQIKTRATTKRGKHIFEVRGFRVRDNFFIVCYQAKLDPDTFWILPSKVFKKYGTSRPKYNSHRLNLTPKRQKMLIEYKDNFDQLTK